MIENTTCVRFVNHTSEPDFAVVTSGSSICRSEVGRRGGRQKVKLVKPNGEGCFNRGKILHEFVHLLGFHHFHRSPMRDDHIKINWENIDREQDRKLYVKSSSDLTDFGTGYDYDSILHPRRTRYSKNGNVTFETVDPKNNHRIGQREKLSEGDILRINRMYKCEDMNHDNKTEN